MNEENIVDIQNETATIENNGKVKVEIKLGNIITLMSLVCSILVLGVVVVNLIK